MVGEIYKIYITKLNQQIKGLLISLFFIFTVMRVFIFTLLIFTSTFCFCQSNFNFLWYNTNDGLSQNSVHCIYRDNEGLVWVGSQDGLNSFDGKKFTHYKPLPNDSTSISDQFILKILQDKQGYIWVGTRYGLNRLDKRTGKCKRFFLDDADKNKFQAVYTNFVLDKGGNIIIAHANKIFKYNYPTETFNSVNNLQVGGHFALTKNDKAYLLITGIGLYKASNYVQSFEKIPISIDGNYQKIISNNSYLLLLSISGKKSVIYVLNSFSDKLEYKIEQDGIITDIFINTENDIYTIGKNGVSIIKHFTQKSFISEKNSNIPPGNLLSIYFDNERNIWLGSAATGLGLYGKNFSNFSTIKIPLKNDVVNATSDEDKFIWIAANSGLYKYNKINSEFKQLIVGKKITGIAKTKNTLYIGVEQEGLWHIQNNGNIIKKYSTKNSLLKSNQILHLSADKKGNILVSTEVNFYIIKNSIWQEIKNPSVNPFVKGFYILHSFEDNENNIWLSTNSGVYAFDSSLQLKITLSSLTDTSPIRRTLVTAVTQDKKNNIWISTINKGIYKYEKNSLTQYTIANGLTSDVVYNLQCDEANRIWAITSNGLHVLNAASNSFTSLSTFDGISTSSFTIGGFGKSLNNQFYLGSSGGVYVFNPTNIQIKDKPLQAKIFDIKINGVSVDSINNSTTFYPHNKTITFEFGITQAFQPSTVLYEYRLDSLDNWIQLPIGITKITYNNVAFKKLNFQVRAAQSITNLKLAPVFNYKIHSIAPFWKTFLFKAIVAIFLLLTIAYFIQLYNKQKYRKQIQLLQTQKELQKERERIGRDLHDNIGAYTSALIAGLNQLESKNVNHLEDLKDYAGNIMGYLRETIWVLHNEQLNITAFADRFKNYAIKISKNYPMIELSFNEAISNDKTLSPQIMLNLFRILQEALQNAFKHAKATEISIYTCSDTKILFKIKDNGVGFLDQSKTDNYGLKNMQQRALEIGFLFAIENDKGTVVTIAENNTNAV
jgi:signal transduction histidine kinase/ligand-binding sensor domain-containing protein